MGKQLTDIIRDIIKHDPEIKAILTPTLTINPAKIEQIVQKVLDEQVQLLDVLDSGDVLKSTIRERLTLGAIPDVEQAIYDKEDGLGNPTVEQRFLTSTPEGFRSWDSPIPLWGTIQGNMSAQNDLTIEFLKHFQKDEYIDESEGGSDHGKPVVLNAQGKLDPTMVVGVDFNPQGEFTPTAGAEYPTAQDPFEVWRIGGLSQGGYLYTTGNLAGRVGHNDNILLYLGAGQWSLLQFSGDTSTFYVLDGSRAITQPFNAGNQRLSHVTDGLQDDDGATVGQLNTAVGETPRGISNGIDQDPNTTTHEYILTSHENAPHVAGINYWHIRTQFFSNNTGNKAQIAISYAGGTTRPRMFIRHNYQFTPGVDSWSDWEYAVDKSDIGLGNADNTSDINKPISTATQTELNKKANGTDLTSHTGNTSNPHTVTKGQIGLDYVDNTSDKNKPVSDATLAMIGETPRGIAESLDQDPNTTAREYILTNHANSPGTIGNTSYWHIRTQFYQAVSGNRAQIAISYVGTPKMLIRHYYQQSGGWSSWGYAVNKDDIGLGNVDNTSDANKPISTATQTALNAKQTIDPNFGIESGEANGGRYIKYPDGTLECYHTGVITGSLVWDSAGAITWATYSNFPLTWAHPFISVPMGSVVCLDGAISSRSAYVSLFMFETDRVGTVYVATFAQTPSTDRSTMTMHYRAIGRWK